MRTKSELLVSRTEALKKPPGTDILIACGTYEFIEEHLLAGGMPSAGVKGKSEPVKMYGMVNMSKAEDIPGAGADGPRSMAMTEGGVENHALAGDMSLISGSAVVKLKKGLTLRDGQSKEAWPVLQLDKGRILGIDYFKENQTLTFARDKVPEAENHVLKVRNVRGKAGAALQACIFTGLYLELNMDCIFPLRSLFSRIVPEPSLFPGWRF